MPILHPIVRSMRLRFAKDEAERQYWRGYHAGQDMVLKRLGIISLLIAFIIFVIWFAL